MEVLPTCLVLILGVVILRLLISNPIFMEITKCLDCQKEFSFYPSASKGKFCSRQCYWESMRGKRKKEIQFKKCEVCNKTIFRKRDSDKQWNVRKFCSNRCYGLWMVGKFLKEKNHSWKGGLPKCIDCGKTVSMKNYTRCRACNSKIHGKDHFNWQGKTALSQIIRTNTKYKIWRKSIFTRDDYTCQTCNQRSGKLVADHIKPFSTILSENNITTLKQALNCKELWNLNNGRTLCKKCHRLK